MIFEYSNIRDTFEFRIVISNSNLECCIKTQEEESPTSAEQRFTSPIEARRSMWKKMYILILPEGAAIAEYSSRCTVAETITEEELVVAAGDKHNAASY